MKQRFLHLLVFAVAMLISTAANAQGKKISVEPTQKAQLEKFMPVQINGLSARPLFKKAPLTAKQAKPQTLVSKKVRANHDVAPANSKPMAKKAPKFAGANYEVTAVDWYYNDWYYDVYVKSEETTYIFELTEDLQYGKTYTYADMNPSWVGTLDDEDYLDVAATDATLTVTKDETGLVHIVGTMVLNGDTYTIKYDEKPFAPSGVKYDLEGTELIGQYKSYYGMYIYTAKVGNNCTIQLAFDATSEQATYTADKLVPDYCFYYSDDYSTYVEFKKLATDITITTTETQKILSGSIYATNGDEYVLKLVFDKPAAKEIKINVSDATLTNKIVAGFWTIDGQTADKNNSFMLYFISKGLQGSFTDVKYFDAYSTWVSDKSSGTNVYYENISAVNITSAVVGDSLVIEGTMTLSDSKGNPANVTLHVSTPFTQTWGEWTDFAPFDKNTGKYTFNTLGNYTQTKVQVQTRKDNTGMKQYVFKNWGAGYWGNTGMDLTINMNPDYTFSFTSSVINLGANAFFQDVATAYGVPEYAAFNYYDPENGVFNFYTAVVLADNGTIYTAAEETMVMDKTILERDTVDIVSTKLNYSDYIASNNLVLYYAQDVPGYTVFRVTSANATSVDGTFKWSEGGVNDINSYFSIDGTDKNYFQDGEFTVVTEGKNIALTGWMIGTDEKYYRLDMSYTVPTVRDTIDVVSNTMTYNDFIASNNAVQFYAGEDADGYQTFLVTSKNATSVDGTFEIYLGYSFAITDEGNEIEFTEGKFTVATEDKGTRLTGWAIGDDEKYYRLNWFKQTVFDKRDTLYFSGENLELMESMDYTSGEQTGWIYMMTDETTNTQFFIQSVADSKYGTFSYEDNTLGTDIYNIIDTLYNKQQFVEGSATVAEVGDSIVLDGEFIAKDDKVYILHFAQSMLPPSEISASELIGDVDIKSYENLGWNEYDLSFSIKGGDGNEYPIALTLDPETATFVGTFTYDDDEETLNRFSNIGVSRQALNIEKGSSITITNMGNGKYAISGTLIYKDPTTEQNITLNLDNITFSTDKVAPNTLLTAGEYEITATITANEGVEVLEELQKYLGGYKAQGELTGDSLELVISTFEEGFTVNGYSVMGDAVMLNDSAEVVYGDKHFQLGDAEGNTNGALAITKTGENEYALADGTVVYNGNVVGTVTGITFKKLDDPTTGINSIEAKAVKSGKFLENGKLVIIRNGVKYGVAGQVK